MRLHPSILFLALVVTVAGACGHRAKPTLAEQVAARQERWHARGVTSYGYDFDQSGFFNGCPHPIHVEVRDDSVVSATVAATGRSVPAKWQCAPSIDGLFQTAIDAARKGELSGIRYYRAGYPREIDIAGPANASGSLFASKLKEHR